MYLNDSCYIELLGTGEPILHYSTERPSHKSGSYPVAWVLSDRVCFLRNMMIMGGHYAMPLRSTHFRKEGLISPAAGGVLDREPSAVSHL